MSRENVERLRPLYDAWRRGAYEEGLDVLDARIEWRAAAEIPGHGGTVYGRVAAEKYLVEWRRTWDAYSVEESRANAGVRTWEEAFEALGLQVDERPG